MKVSCAELLFTTLVVLLLVIGEGFSQNVRLQCYRDSTRSFDLNYGIVTPATVRKDLVSVSMENSFSKGWVSLSLNYTVNNGVENQHALLTVIYSVSDRLYIAEMDGVEVQRQEMNKMFVLKSGQIHFEANIERDNGFSAAVLYPVYNTRNVTLHQVIAQQNLTAIAGDLLFTEGPLLVHDLSTIGFETTRLCRELSNMYGMSRGLSMANEATFVFSKSFNVCFSVVNIILLFCMRKRQLITSRFIAPFVSAFGLLFYDGILLIMSICMLADVSRFETILNVGLRVDRKILQPMFPIPIFIAVTFYILNVIRYFYVRNIYLLIDNSRDASADAQIALHKRIASKMSYVFVALGLNVVILVITLAIGIPLAIMDVDLTRMLAMTIIVLASNVTVALFGVAATLIDLLIHIKEIKEAGIGNYLFFKDPLMFRIECLIIIPGIIVGVFMYIFLLIGQIDFRVRYPILAISDVVFGTILRLVISGGFVCIIEFKRYISQSAQPHRNSAEYQSAIEAFLSKPDQYELIKSYCQREFSSENLQLWTELNTLKKGTTRESISKEQFLWIYHRFIKPGSLYQVNFSSHVIPNIEAMMSQYAESPTVPLEKLYGIVYLDLLANITDTFTRLKTTREYQLMIQKKQLSSDLLGKEFNQN